MKRGKKPNLTAVSSNAGAAPLGPPPQDWSDGQKSLWWEVVANIPARLVTRSDRVLVELACRQLAAIREGDHTNAAMTEMRRILGELGMTPTERMRMTKEIPRDPEENPFSSI